MDIDINLLKIKPIRNSPNYIIYYNNVRKCRISIDNTSIIKIEDYNKKYKIAYIKNKNFNSFLCDVNSFLLNKNVIKKDNTNNILYFDKKYGLLNKIYFSIEDNEYDVFKKNVNTNIKLELDLISVNVLDNTNYILKYQIVNIDNRDCYFNDEIEDETGEYPEPCELDLIKEEYINKIVNEININKNEIEKLNIKNKELTDLINNIYIATTKEEIIKSGVIVE
jgi:hypothetical protein